ncbi:Possible osmoprotectant (glycine betaine/ carnitine/choline/l-proline) ABC transporter ProZ [Mycobacteroides abscessus subsp. abscessus]|nr:Possible osmoprotectant (glycine betaine/ carnitine/choline/l-proline) ABC transporter ProZ [Mycobacteroides abscessus subsp. abscessus]
MTRVSCWNTPDWPSGSRALALLLDAVLALAVWLSAPGTGRLRPVPDLPDREGQAVYADSGVSAGTMPRSPG